MYSCTRPCWSQRASARARPTAPKSGPVQPFGPEVGSLARSARRRPGRSPQGRLHRRCVCSRKPKSVRQRLGEGGCRVLHPRRRRGVAAVPGDAARDETPGEQPVSQPANSATAAKETAASRQDELQRLARRGEVSPPPFPPGVPSRSSPGAPRRRSAAVSGLRPGHSRTPGAAAAAAAPWPLRRFPGAIAARLAEEGDPEQARKAGRGEPADQGQSADRHQGRLRQRSPRPTPRRAKAPR